MRRDVFQAIADPTRREIIHLISKKTLNLNAIADNFDISRPAVSQHMKILIECGLVTVEAVGRERFCRAKLDGLKEVHTWTEQYRIFWTKKLDALGVFLANESPTSTKREKNKKNPFKKKTR
jgi:DNA-binding transcriptional ArsR family regulator